MWGTDWPIVEAHCGYAKALAMVRDEMKFLNEEDKRWMLSGTVERVWKWS
jgi:predicted TIM-barrel fold metal-dependent hydrolase